jgi:predicted PurR-regulated permease PerM
MTASRRALFWLAGAAAFVVALNVFSPILLPFVAAMAIAYFLDPAADWLERRGVWRWLASALILALFFAAGVAVVVLLAPLLQAQLVELVRSVPDFVAWLREQLLPLAERLYGGVPGAEVTDLRGLAATYAGDVVAWLGSVVKGLWSGGLALLNLVSLLIVTPVVAFYLLRDWDRLVARIDGLLPRAQAPVIREQIGRIDRIIADYVRGVALVCLFLAAAYGIALTVVGLQFGLVIGIGAGLISFIPFLGALAGFLVGVGLALFQFSEWTPIAAVAGIFVVGQVLEGNVLTPRLVGGRIGLHPVWVLFALFAGGALFGFVGVLLAVPVAASIGVLGRFAVARYLGSGLYLGPVGRTRGDGAQAAGAGSRPPPGPGHGGLSGRRL